MSDSLAIGSEAWTNGVEYGGEYIDRINQFIADIDDNALTSCASSLRENQPCTLSPRFSVGNFNLVRKIQFEDGVEWVARLRMPAMADEDGGKFGAVSPEKMLLDFQSELATMEFVR